MQFEGSREKRALVYGSVMMPELFRHFLIAEFFRSVSCDFRRS